MTKETAAAAPKPPDSSLKTRLKSAMVLAPAVLFILWFGGGGFALMMAAVAGIGAYEWTRMVTKGQPFPGNMPFFAAILTTLGTVTAGMVGNPVVSLWFLLGLCFLIFAYNYSRSGPPVRRIVLGVIYIGFAVGVMIWLRNGSEHGLFNILTLLFIVWASDSFAYFSGRAIGGPKLAPAISPKKTWAGFIGGSIGAGIVAAIMALPPLTGLFGVETLGGMGPVGYFTLGFFLSMVGQAGDLFISLIKRFYDVKDTGAIIPGHGGILDRIDALLLVALLFGALAAALGA